MSNSSPLAVLEPLLQDPAVTEITIDAPDRVSIERRGVLQDAGLSFPSPEALRAAIDAVLALGGVAFQAGQTVAEARLPDGSRAVAVLAPTAVNAGPYLVLRKFWKVQMTLERLLEYKSLDQAMVTLLQSAIRARRNLLVAGGTGSGKTTMLNLFTDLIPAEERVIAVESVFELHLRHPRAINLAADASPDISYSDLIKTAGKMRPDRLIFGELHGPETLEIADLINVGYDGSMATVHAVSPEDALGRLETQCLTANLGLGLAEIRTILAAAFNLITYQQRLANGHRVLTEIVEVRGVQNDRYVLQPLVRYDPETGTFKQLAKPSWG